MSGYTKPCIYCKREIKLSNDSGKWLPYNLDGSGHECRPSKQGQGQQQPKEENKSTTAATLSLEKIFEHISRLEIRVSELDKKMQRVFHTLYAE